MAHRVTLVALLAALLAPGALGLSAVRALLGTHVEEYYHAAHQKYVPLHQHFRVPDEVYYKRTETTTEDLPNALTRFTRQSSSAPPRYIREHFNGAADINANALSGYRKLWDHTGNWLRDREQRYRTYYQGKPTTTPARVEHEHELHEADGRYGHLQDVTYRHRNKWKIDQFLEDAGIKLDHDERS